MEEEMKNDMVQFVALVVLLTVGGAVAMFLGLETGEKEDSVSDLAQAVKVLQADRVELASRLARLEASTKETNRRLSAYINKLNQLSIAYIDHHGMYPWKEREEYGGRSHDHANMRD